MSKSRTHKLLFTTIALSLLTVLAVVFVWPKEMVLQQTARRTFYVDMPFDLVRKILVRTESTPAILRRTGNGKLLEYEWVNRGIGLDKLNVFAGDWHIDAQAKITLQTKATEQIPSQRITLQQDTDVEIDFVKSVIALEEATGPLQNYENVSHFTRDGERTKVELSVLVAVRISVPRLAISYAEDQIREYGHEELKHQETATREVLKESQSNPLVLLPGI